MILCKKAILRRSVCIPYCCKGVSVYSEGIAGYVQYSS